MEESSELLKQMSEIMRMMHEERKKDMLNMEEEKKRLQEERKVEREKNEVMMSKFVETLKALSGTNASVVSRDDVGNAVNNCSDVVKPSLDALEARIQNFEYDPEEDKVFELWFEMYRDIFEHDSLILEEKARVRMLLRHLGFRENRQYRVGLQKNV